MLPLALHSARQGDFLSHYLRLQITKGCFGLYLFFKGQIEQLRNNPTLKRLYRWELSCNNDMIVKLREQREKVGIDLVKKVSELTGYPQKEIAAIASMLTASITYLVMLEDFCPVYNGIPLNENSGWEQINEGIEILINKVFQDEN